MIADSEIVDARLRLDVFVLENHADTLIYLQTYLEGLGHSVRTAGTMSGALEALRLWSWRQKISGDSLECLRLVPTERFGEMDAEDPGEGGG